ncbi:hypothetical protein [Agrilutibacter solisilvae]|uniref:Uncharacterized protein n=1 Tax=Agrilutibacter solisilvae TaxID=2763317 RepID=A0A974Y3P3_9GAMM|nr:hypothetical protein [Lysobacter solisilvae]QSX77236.1 hypothetical protein I8J32_010570 [Lysobacter solisilvae]
MHTSTMRASTMRAATLVIAVPLLAMLAACARQPSPPGLAEEDGESCAVPAHGKKVYIDVAYDGSGRPSVTPDECEVDNGTAIVWRTAKDVKGAFEIEFEGESAAGPGAPKRVRSEEKDARQKAQVTSENKVARYKYAIEANGHRVDPAIIIRR